MLGPLDILVLLKLCAKRDVVWTQRQIADELLIAVGSVHGALKTAEQIQLYSAARKQVSATRIEEALVHGARYFLAPKVGGETRGMPTSWAAPPLVHQLAASDAVIPVWPDPEGKVRGIAFEPLHKSVPAAARRDPLLYELLTLVDVLREGRARESQIAAAELHNRLHPQ